MSTLPTINLLRELEQRPAAAGDIRVVPQLKRRQPLITLLVDALMLALAGVLVKLSSGIAGIHAPPGAWVLVFSVLALVLLANRGLYHERGLLPHLLDQVRTIVSATAVATMAVMAVRVLLADEVHNAAQLAECWLFASTCLTVGRVALYTTMQARTAEHGGKPTLIIGAGKVGHLLARRLVQRKEFGLQPVGFLDADPLFVDNGVPLPVLGASWDLEDVIADRAIEHVIFTFSTAPHEVMLSMIRRCEDAGVTVSHVPRLFETAVERVTVEHVGGLPIMTMRPANPQGWQFFVKYAVDRLVAGLMLLVLSPLLLLLAIAVKLATGGPVFFRQPRVGLDGHEFDMLKFRTMKGCPEEHGESDADWAAQILNVGPGPKLNGGDQAGALNGKPLNGGASNGHAVSVPDRRTRLGRFLRSASLDELPQLWNVVLGDMSLIGPRPERESYARQFQRSVHRYGDRHRVKSGITGWAQVHGLRGKTSLEDRVEWDNYYIENWSLWLDFKILLLTFGSVLRWREQ